MDLVFNLLPAAVPYWLRVGLAGVTCAVILITLMALGPIAYVYVETKIAGFMQDRIGPKRVGPHGLLQTVADAVKLMFKEAIYPAGADRCCSSSRLPGGRRRVPVLRGPAVRHRACRPWT
jgi:NADH:ubiquinone oxidoreductase subunit H